MNSVKNCGVKFTGGLRKTPQKAIERFEQALKIAYKNPDTHKIIECTDDGDLVNIVRYSGGNCRKATYNIKNGELIGLARRPYNDNGIVLSDAKGNFTIKDFINSNKEYFNKSFSNFKDFLKYFREELPVIKR